MNVPKEVTIYAAGFFDGEGCVSTNMRGHSIQVQISQVNRAPLDYLQGFYGGRVFYQYTKANKQRTNGIHVLSMSGISARNFLRNVLPYCLVKDADIKSAFEYTGHNLEDHETSEA